MAYWPSSYFTPKEVLSPNGLRAYEKRGILLVRRHALVSLDSLRHYTDEPISVNHAGMVYRGFRDAVENKKIGGASLGQHPLGVAFDSNCYALGLEGYLRKVLEYTRTQFALDTPYHQGVRGLGIYTKKNFLHIDYRYLPSKYEHYVVVWNGDSNRIPTFIINKDLLVSGVEPTLNSMVTALQLPQQWRR